MTVPKTPEDDPHNYKKNGYWRCGRNDGCGQTAGWGTDHVGVGACKLHGGAGGAPSGPDHGRWKHGLNSAVVRSEDEALLEAIQNMGRAEILRQTLENRTMKVYRALDEMKESERASFWEALAELMVRVKNPTADELSQIARMVGENDRAIREEIKLIIRNADKLHKITDGQDLNLNVGVDKAELAELQDTFEDLL